MFKTPAKEKPQERSLCPVTFSNSKDVRTVPKPEEKPLLCTPENYGWFISPLNTLMSTIATVDGIIF